MQRVVRGILPVGANLNVFNIPVEKACKRCDGGEESVSHAIFNCYKAREVWRLHQQYIYKFNQAQQREQPLTSIGGQK